MNSTAALLRHLVARCHQIDLAWSSQAYSLSAFPDLVLAQTSDLDLTPFGQLDQLIPLIKEPELASLQQLSSFSDLYLKLFDNGRFWVEVLNWWGSDINIHDHDFAGIQFQLSGCSLNVDYAFEEHQSCTNVCFGTVSVKGAKLWRPGDRSISLPGRMTPHVVCHLDLPTVSLLIRTHPVARFGPQWNYFPPGVAGNYGIADATFRKSVTALRLLSRGDPTRFRIAFRQFVVGATMEQLLFALIKMIDIVFETRFIDLIDAIAATGDPAQERIIEAAAYHRTVESLKALRHRSELSWNERMALSVLACSFDAESTKVILSALGSDGEIDIASILQKLRSTSVDAQSVISTAQSLFVPELGEACEEAAK